jgi:beta-lactam-binding protein with PASTA domain
MIYTYTLYVYSIYTPTPAPDNNPTSGIIPDVISDVEQTAIEDLKNAGFTSISAKTVPNPDIYGNTGIAGTVHSQSPIPDENYYEFNTLIKLQIWDTLEAELPDLVGFTKDDAEKKLKNVGFENIIIENCDNDISSEKNGVVATQDPKYDNTGNNRYDLGTEITLTVYSDYVPPSNDNNDDNNKNNTGGTGGTDDTGDSDNTENKNSFLNVILIILAIGILIIFFYFLFVKNVKGNNNNITPDLLF